MNDRRSAADRFDHLSAVLDAARDRVREDIESASELLDTVGTIVASIDGRVRAGGAPDARTREAAERVRRSHADLMRVLRERAVELRSERAELDAIADALSHYGAAPVTQRPLLLDRVC